jgi:ribonucleoside-diphosphate reductase alpha chain
MDNAVSKTINLPAEATPDKILEICSNAFQMGLKGVTVFRSMSRGHQILSCGTNRTC